MRRSLVLGLALAATLITESPAPAQTQTADANLTREVGELVEAAALGDQVSIDIRDAVSGRPVFQLRPDLALNPASNMKVVTAAAALERLGGETRFLTGAYGRLENGAVRDLVLEGHGDPELDQDDLLALARQLADRGVRSVERVLVDADYFDDHLLPPAFDQQPNETAYFRAAVGGLVVDRSTFTLRVIPGEEGTNATARLRGAGYFDVSGTVATAADATGVVLTPRALPDGRMRLRLGGGVPPSDQPSTFRQRVENPVLYAGYLFAEALGTVGIRGARAVSVGGVAANLPLLATHASAPLATLLHSVGKNSDNFVAEMILKQLGARPGTPASSEAGAANVTQYLESLGVPHGAFTIVNGSGLFRGNRIATSHLATVLVHAYQTPAIRSEYIAQLAIAGVDGTLEHRLEDLPAPRMVRAKTGTLNDVISLSGYVLSPDAGRAYAFSCIANGVAGKGAAARQLFDGVVRALATRLAPRRDGSP